MHREVAVALLESVELPLMAQKLEERLHEGCGLELF